METQKKSAAARFRPELTKRQLGKYTSHKITYYPLEDQLRWAAVKPYDKTLDKMTVDAPQRKNSNLSRVQ